MAPRIVRPASDAARWPVAVASGVAALVLGYVGAAKVFRPAGPATVQGAEEGGEGEGPSGGEPVGAEDAGAAGTTVAVVDAGRPAAVVRPPPRVGVRVVRTIVQSCGDGEELTTPGPQCGQVPGLESTLASYLPELGNCPSAEQAALHQPEGVLSIGLRVDFARRRVTALPGRSSSVRDALTYVACARTALEHTDALWQLHAPHARYLYFFMVRFGPVRAASDAGVAAPTTPAAPTPAAVPTPAPPTPAPSTPAPAAPSAPVLGVPLVRPEPGEVTWARALVRDAPRTGAVIAHLAQGAPITVVARQGSWWRVRYPGGEGWIYGEAIGR